MIRLIFETRTFNSIWNVDECVSYIQGVPCSYLLVYSSNDDLAQISVHQNPTCPQKDIV